MNIEIIKRKELDNLFSDIEKVVSTKEGIIFPDDGQAYNPSEYLCEDGFYPGYFDATKKILFIGREARYNSGCNRIDVDTNSPDGWLWKNNVNTSSFWRRLFYIAYGVKMNKYVPFDELPEADEIKNDMLTNRSFNFALINVSKYSNDSEKNWQSNYYLINRFLQDSELDKRNFLREEIKILDPDIVISANLWETSMDMNKLGLVFPEEDFSAYNKKLSTVGCSAVYDFNFEGKIIPFIDLYHFSAPGKADCEDFYNPAMKAIYKK